jgi:hypothetical protein
VVSGAGTGRAMRAEQPRPHWRERQEQRSPDMAVPRPPRPRPAGPARVAVVYYLARNGHLEHPHFMEVALASPEGLYLRGTWRWSIICSAHGHGAHSFYLVSFCH